MSITGSGSGVSRLLPDPGVCFYFIFPMLPFSFFSFFLSFSPFCIFLLPFFFSLFHARCLV